MRRLAEDSCAASQVDWDKMVLTTRVNGEVRQSQRTAELIVSLSEPLPSMDSDHYHSKFNIPTLIETASLGITLQPGDVIATGAPGKRPNAMRLIGFALKSRT